ncbi:hypothetical protein PVAND_015194 [Polypedilum vanderplanki]|uniref:Cytochrome P450 n=1 Tax=Polypedilum vanderplanki TaxID=319348 RepID=A0A9J6BCC7_POLVA|nr:hypothetical protein PVAND_015194 [Polypedilum vanderplanki]
MKAKISLLNFTRVFCSMRNAVQNAKPYSEVPTVSVPKFILRNLPGGKYYKKSLKEIQESFYNEFGNIFKLPAMFGKPEMIFIYKADDFETTSRAEGALPIRMSFDTLKYYRATKQSEVYAEYGSLATSDGEKWYKTRSQVNPIMLQPKVVQMYTKQIDEVSKEFVQIMRDIKDDKNEMPKDFKDYISRWSIESIATIAVEKRLNILSGKTDDERGKKFINVTLQFFEKLSDFEMKPSIWRYYETKAFKELMEVYDSMTSIIFSYVDEAIKRFENEETKGTNEIQEESVLRKLLKVNKNLAFVVASDLLVSDLTTSVVVFTLYLLAKNPEKQEKLRSELMSIMTNKNSPIKSENMKNLPYLRAVIKESLRIFPIGSGNTRNLSKDVVLAGYHVPKDTMVFMNAYIELSNPKYYPEPEKFIPERWLRDEKYENWRSKEINPFAFLPFGFGARSCIGKRFGELQIENIIMNIIRNFKLEWNYPDMKVRSLLANFPDSDLKFKITEV